MVLVRKMVFLVLVFLVLVLRHGCAIYMGFYGVVLRRRIIMRLYQTKMKMNENEN